MSTATLSHFFAILSLITWAGTILTIVLAVIRRLAPESGPAFLFEDLGGVALWLGWLVAAVTMAGSLYYSIGPPQFVPVRAVLVPAHLPLPDGGHHARRRAAPRPQGLDVRHADPPGRRRRSPSTTRSCRPSRSSSRSARPSTPCTTRYVWEFGFVSLPFMSLAASTFIITMVLVARATDPEPLRRRGRPAPRPTPLTLPARRRHHRRPLPRPGRCPCEQPSIEEALVVGAGAGRGPGQQEQQHAVDHRHRRDAGHRHRADRRRGRRQARAVGDNIVGRKAAPPSLVNKITTVPDTVFTAIGQGTSTPLPTADRRQEHRGERQARHPLHRGRVLPVLRHRALGDG